MSVKVTTPRTKQLLLRDLSLTDHWRLEIWSRDNELGKEEAAEKILADFLKKIKLDLDENTKTKAI